MYVFHNTDILGRVFVQTKSKSIQNILRSLPLGVGILARKIKYFLKYDSLRFDFVSLKLQTRPFQLRVQTDPVSKSGICSTNSCCIFKNISTIQ